MSEPLTFLMGKYAAVLPGELSYARNHMWCRDVDGRRRFGFTSYAVRLMQDVYFLDWSFGDGTRVEHLQPIGHIETSKAQSDLFAPLAGTILRFNPLVLSDPSLINVENHGAGWLFEMDADGATLLSAAEYRDFLAANWEKTERLLKGQVNQES